MQSYEAILSARGFTPRASEGRAELSGTSPESAPGNAADPYVERFMAAIDKMRARPNPSECLPWLAVANPSLHAVLTQDLPDRLERIWNARGDIRAFQLILDLIVDAHRQAGELYRTAHPGR